ncbi:MAG TPA: hypothetical protein DF637_01245 [Rikenellaceae bacterium]|nr:hypothetical protein [Rikenellaceae bacterium]HCV14948.1 hypothetical protein [Rikenellaceae bacterium]
MQKSMTLFGCGPKLALICLPYIVLSLVMMYKNPGFLDLAFIDSVIFRVTGLLWLSIGLIFWAYSAVYFLKNFKPGSLITQGPFSLCRNPIYSAIIVFIIPALAIIFHSGLTLSIALVLYIGFKISIHGETIILRRIFGDEYTNYENSVNEIFPYPRHILPLNN